MSNFKFLVRGVTCGIAVLGMNSVYADDSSTKYFFNKKEAPSLEAKVKKLSPVQVKKPSNVSETKLNLDTSKLNLVDNDNDNDNDKSKSVETKQFKTHFGIGYEYRKTMQEQLQRSERVVRPEKTQRRERVERPRKNKSTKKNGSSR